MTEEQPSDRDPIEGAFEALGHKRRYNLGDLVSWAGDLWYIEGHQFEAARSGTESYEDIEYSLSKVYGDGTYNDYAEVFQDDEELRLVCEAGKADEYIQTKGVGRLTMSVAFSMPGRDNEPVNRPPKRTITFSKERELRELRRQAHYRESVDRLLDEYNNAQGNESLTKLDELTRLAEIHEAGGWA